MPTVSSRLLTVGILRPIDETWKLDNIQLESIVIKMTPSLAVSDRRKMQCLGTRTETGCVYNRGLHTLVKRSNLS